MFVKICGTTNLPDAQLAVDLGADAVGFVFAPSKRRVTVAEAAAISRALAAHVVRVGVFTEPDAGTIVHAVREAELNTVQLHTTYSAPLVAELHGAFGRRVALWQVVNIEIETKSDATLSLWRQSLREALVDARLTAVLLDSARMGASGGRGEPFSWKEVAPLLSSLREGHTKDGPQRAASLPRLIVAGGLHAGNVREAVETLAPWGVDVVSGVEAHPGKKDPERMAAFLRAARSLS